MHNIFLIGFMGSGKSTVGRLLARKFQLDFIDLDTEIEKNTGLTINEIFTQKGETAFREIEHRQLTNVLKRKGFICATGGGAPCYHGNMDRMNGGGHTFYLNTGVTELLKRLQKETETRPLLQQKDHEELKIYISQKLKERTPFYKQAKHIISAEQPPSGIVEEIARILTNT